jgi:hypothetical protein
MITPTTDIENKIIEFFEENYESLRMEGGHTLSEAVMETAKQQVLLYWRKLSEIANKVTQTEVKLALPNQQTTEGRRFTIEGIVDIVKEGYDTWMYDIKTHDLEYIRQNKNLYEQQLNVYAYIWQTLRKNHLDYTAVISTALPDSLRNAIQQGNQEAINTEINKWEPVVPLNFDQTKVDETVADFAEIVDRIENHKFAPPAVEVLNNNVPGAQSHEQFGTRVCRNCDARFSCNTFREYAMAKSGKLKANFQKYYNDWGTPADQEDWLNAGLSDNNIPETTEFVE